MAMTRTDKGGVITPLKNEFGKERRRRGGREGDEKERKKEEGTEI